MLQWWTEFSKRPFVAHLLRAVERFNLRGGAQLAAAVTYFSVLALVPITMFAFATLGVILTVFRPDMLGQIESWIYDQVQADSTLGKNLYDVIAGALNNWASISIVALGIMIWVGSGWVGNLKRAVRLLMREDVDRPGKLLPMPLDVLANFAGLVVLLVGVAAIGASIWAAGAIGEWLGLQSLPGWSWLLRVVGYLLSLAIGVLLFRVMFAWFAPHHVPSHLAWVASGLGSLGLVVLLSLAGLLLGIFSGNVSTILFGSTIVVMLFLNLFATLLLYIAAWLATSAEPAPEPEPLAGIEAVAEEPVESRPGELYVSSEVARRSLGIGLGTGYVVGAAAGVGIGAIITSVLGRLFGRRG